MAGAAEAGGTKGRSIPPRAGRRAPFFYGWVVVAAAFAVLFLAFGSAYSFATFFAALQDEFAASRGSVSLAFAIAGFIYFSLGALSGTISDRLEPRWVVAGGMMVVAAGLLLASRATDLGQIYVAYGIGMGIGVGFAYVPAIGVVQRWFVRHRGLASGLAVAGIGLGTVSVPPASAWLIQAGGWRTAYVVLGIVVLVVGCGAALALEKSPDRRGLLPDGDPAGPQPSAAVGAPPLAQQDGFGVWQALATRPFAVLYAASLLGSLGLFVPFVHLVPYARDLGLSPARGALLFSLIGVGSTAGRFVAGGVADRLGRRISLAGLYGGMGLAFLLWLGAESAWRLAVFALGFGVFYGGFVALVPAVIADYFGFRSVAGIIGLLYTSVGIGNLVGPTFAGIVFDMWQSYAAPIAISAALMLAAAGLTFLLEEPDRWRRRCGL